MKKFCNIIGVLVASGAAVRQRHRADRILAARALGGGVITWCAELKKSQWRNALYAPSGRLRLARADRAPGGVDDKRFS